MATDTTTEPVPTTGFLGKIDYRGTFFSAINATFGSLVETNVNYPPVMAVIEAVEALSPKQNLELSFTFSKTNRLDHVELLVYQKCGGVWINAISVRTLNIELVPTSNRHSHIASSNKRHRTVNGLEVLISAFQQLQGWSREQCIPNDTVWQWLNCMGDNPPRVTSIYLSGYDLDDPLPDFSQMDDALEAIDLRNNHLDGPIPVVLGKLLNLTLLIGSSNNQSESIRLALIIGLAVGLPIFFLFIVALVFLLVRKQKTSTQGQVTAVELGGNRVTTTGQS
ncbi:hypothetical protein Golob_009977 [Gossypium lobatum]|uniref:Malectin-like domain-containing protein n=1 Tax=Gossypium lobatum TaxID=34289 RepID=A0A7J8MK39_9ROSI|nr:hypothetical protein [Gossypium lobatum]